MWYELLTSAPKGAIAFYTEVVGWQTQRWDTGDYTMWATAQGPLGGVTELPELAKKMGAPPHWQGNVQVDNLDETIAKVKALGGNVIHAEDVPTIGRLAVIADPQGAVIAIFQPLESMAPHDLVKDGEFSWHELYTTDHAAAFEFYRQVFGWEKLDEVDLGPMGTYWLWGREGKMVGGMMTLPPGMKAPDGSAVPPSWMYYVTIANLDAALERAKAKGARVLNGPMQVPGGQRIVQLMDPQGAVFAITTP